MVGWDKGILTEQQTKGKATTMIQKRGIHKTNQQNRTALSDRMVAEPSWAASVFPPPSSPPPEPSMTAHGMEYPALFGQVGSAPPASWILVKINPVLAKPRKNNVIIYRFQCNWKGVMGEMNVVSNVQVMKNLKLWTHG